MGDNREPDTLANLVNFKCISDTFSPTRLVIGYLSHVTLLTYEQLWGFIKSRNQIAMYDVARSNSRNRRGANCQYVKTCSKLFHTERW